MKVLSLFIYRPLLILGVVLFLVSHPVDAVSRTQVTDPVTGESCIVEDVERFLALDRPVVAVSLSGGGAKGIANLGVLKALEEENIPIDLVVGTSMGALIGILYGSGMDIEQIEAALVGIDPAEHFYLSFPFHRSLLNGSDLNRAIEKLTPTKRLEEFPIPTAVLSYDLNHGTKYVQTTGPVAQAVQGPYAIPGLFPGRALDDYYLVDAGIHESAPAFAARQLGADIVIATTTFREYSRDDYGGPLTGWLRMINLIQQDYSHAVLDRYASSVVHLDVTNYSFMDFHLARRLIDMGYQEAKKQTPKIKEVLQRNGIGLRPPRVKRPIDWEHIFQDLKYDRIPAQELTTRPILSYGKKHTTFGSRQFVDDSTSIQFGAELALGPWTGWAVTTGASLDNLEAETRLLKLTPNLDAKAQMDVTSKATNWSLGLAHYTKARVLEAGYARVGGDQHLLTRSSYQHGTRWRGETRALVHLASLGDGDFSAELCSTGAGEINVGDTISLNPKLVYADAKHLQVPAIYRGAEFNPQESRWQAGLDLVFQQTLPYSLELLNTLRFGGFNHYLFVDWMEDKKGQAMAVGLGSGLGLSLFGLKQTGLDAYVSYDLVHDSHQVRLSFAFGF